MFRKEILQLSIFQFGTAGQVPQISSFVFSAEVFFISSFETGFRSKSGQVFVVLQVDIWLYENL